MSSMRLSAQTPDVDSTPSGSNYDDLIFTPNPIIAAEGVFEPGADDPLIAYATSPIVGNVEAPVTMHIFSDFQCHFCKEFHEVELPLAIDEFVRSGDVRLVFNDFPRLGSNPGIADPYDLTIELSDPENEFAQAAHAAMCAGEQGAYLQMADKLFQIFDGVQTGAFSGARLLQFAEELGLDINQFSASMESGKYLPALAKFVEVGESEGIMATPMFILDNGSGMPILVQSTGQYEFLEMQIQMAVDTAEP